MTWSQRQGYAFAGIFGACALTEFVGEIQLYRHITMPQESRVLKNRFWTQYVMGVALFSCIGALGYTAVNTFSKSGWGKLAWAMAVLPIPLLATGFFALHGVDAAIGASTGNTSAGLVRGAMKKSVIMSAKS